MVADVTGLIGTEDRGRTRLAERGQELQRAHLEAAYGRRLTILDAATEDGERTLAAVSALESSLASALGANEPWTAVELFSPYAIARQPEYLEMLEELRALGGGARQVLELVYSSASSMRARGLLVMFAGDLRLPELLPLVDKAMVSSLRARSRPMLEATAYAMARSAGPETLDRMSVLLGEFEPDALWSAALHRAAGAHGPEGVTLLEAEFHRLRQGGFELKPHMVLGAVTDTAAVPALRATLEACTDPRLRSMALCSLARLCDPSEIESLASNPDWTREERIGFLSGITDRTDGGGEEWLLGWIVGESDAELVANGLAGAQWRDDPRWTEAWLVLTEPGRVQDGDADQQRQLLLALTRGMAESSSPVLQMRLRNLFDAASVVDQAHMLRELGLTRELPSEWRGSLLAALDQGLTGEPGDAAAIVSALSRVQGDKSAAVQRVLEAARRTADDTRCRSLLAALSHFEGALPAEPVLQLIDDLDDPLTRMIGLEVLKGAEDVPSYSTAILERQTLSQVFDLIESARISRLLLTNPDSRMLHGLSLRNFAGRVAEEGDLPRMRDLSRRYSHLGKASSLAMMLDGAIQQVEARHGKL